MAKRSSKSSRKFGERIAMFRKKAGLTQRDLAAELGISQRMVAYYEKHANTLPAHLLPDLTKTLGVSTEQILGTKDIGKSQKVPDTRLWRRFKEVEKLPPEERRQITKLLDTFIEKEKLKQAV